MVLNGDDVLAFTNLGYCVVRSAFSPAQGERARASVLRRMALRGYDFARRNEWPTSFTFEETVDEPEVLECFTDRLSAAICELVGADNWTGARQWGLWSVNVGSATPPASIIPSYGWHIDGNWFQHTLTAHKQGLVVLGLFTDVAETDGPTVVSGGSHRLTSRVLARYEDGIHHLDLFKEVLRQPIGDFQCLTGQVGDVWLAHPFLFHTRGARARGEPRIISNTEAPLRVPMRVVGDKLKRSVLEDSIAEALLAEPPAPNGAMQCTF